MARAKAKLVSNEKVPVEHAPVSAPVKRSPVFDGVRIFFFDAGVSIVVYFILGLVLVVAGYSASEIQNNKILEIIGLLISVYAAFLLYKNYSSSNKALISLVVTALVVSLINIFGDIATTGVTNLATRLLSTVADLVCYGIGWYLASTTGTKLYLLKKGWVTTFFVIGIISTFFGFIVLIAQAHIGR